MELVVESDVYSPSIDENGNYIDKIPSFSLIKKGLLCPCGSRKDKTYENATKFADDPELTVIACAIPINFAKFFSNRSLNLPAVNHPSRDALTIFLSSSLPMSLPDGGIEVMPGRKILFSYSIAEYSSTNLSI